MIKCITEARDNEIITLSQNQTRLWEVIKLVHTDASSCAAAIFNSPFLNAILLYLLETCPQCPVSPESLLIKAAIGQTSP